MTPELEQLAFTIHAAGYHHPDDIESGLARRLWDADEWPREFDKARRCARSAVEAIRAMVGAEIGVSVALNPAELPQRKISIKAEFVVLDFLDTILGKPA